MSCPEGTFSQLVVDFEDWVGGRNGLELGDRVQP
jgi:hypothetical protein